VKLERGLSAIASLAVLVCWFGTGSAQTATPAATPAPSVCQFQDCAASGTAVDCRTGAESPPSVFGISGGNFNSIDKNGCCTGTLGALVKDAKTGNLFALSANHVLARASSTTKAARKNELIVQPGLVDLGCFQDSSDQVAKLSSWVPLNFSGAFNTVDAAIALDVNNSLDPTGTIFNVGTIGNAPPQALDLVDGSFVMKMGRASCLTLGQIDATDAMGKVTYVSGGNSLSAGTANFDHQILVIGANSGAFTQPGDSGSVVLTAPEATGSGACPQAIGLLFASNASGTIAAVNPINTVLTALKVSLVGQCVGGAATTEQNQFSASVEGPSDALRSSREQVRIAKEQEGRRLLKLDEVVAVGIGAGDDPDHAALAVYVKNDPSEVSAKIPSKIGGVPVKVKQAGAFRSAVDCGASPFAPALTH